MLMLLMFSFAVATPSTRRADRDFRDEFPPSSSNPGEPPVPPSSSTNSCTSAPEPSPPPASKLDDGDDDVPAEPSHPSFPTAFEHIDPGGVLRQFTGLNFDVLNFDVIRRDADTYSLSWARMLAMQVPNKSTHAEIFFYVVVR
ncbi:hypothetical protein CYMTET_17530 [Cymbomonas tetramitiformis]|uniref:Uncharacterized protein n=1 Tax=Cymbomonas tetramitiformis TaxID=36881 RepID=A0AAE0GAI7_9CHLO|nr:hypothetical protein CYMTET_17530 [Cymbomonas tetramitiformis]